MIKKLLLTAGTSLAAASMAFADGHGSACGPEGQSVRILGSDFPAIQAISNAAEAACAGAASEFTIALRDNTRDIMNQALTPNPSEYSSVIVANSTLTQLMNDGLVRPLNDLVEKYGQNLSANQLITIDGNIMAIAFMANSQHLFARTDILEQAGVDSVPGTVEEILAAAEAIREAGIMEFPLVMNMQAGWNVGEVFNLFYFAHGGDLFVPGSAEANIDNEKARAALADIKALTEYANPAFLSQASNETQATWEAGEAALGIMWGSRGGAILDDEGSTEDVTSNTILAGAPTAGGGDIPAATLWWDGITIAANIPDEEAEAAFAALVGAMNPEMVAANNDAAIWLLDGFEPGPAAAGVFATAGGGAKPYPMIPYVNLMHNALGAELVDFLNGTEDADQALADVIAAYEVAATEEGFL